jgi:hypothetical protein
MRRGIPLALLLALACAGRAELACADAASSAAIPTSGAMQKWLEARAVQRAGRAELQRGAEKDRLERAAAAVKISLEMLEKAKADRVAGQDAQFKRMCAFIDYLDPTQVGKVASVVEALPAEPAMSEAKALKTWAAYADPKWQALVGPTEKLGQKALDFGVFDIAHDCLDQVLTFNPDNPGLRKALNFTKAGGRWYGPKDMDAVRSGLQWDDKLGWIVAKEAARYAKGDYFDLQEKRWTTMEAAEAAHATLDREWHLLTEHLEISGNAPLAALVDVANRLEEFYAQIFASYAAFFAKDKSDVKLIFGLLDHERLLVSVAKDKADYRKSLPSGVDPGWTAGMWIPAVGSSFFYAGPKAVIYHEFTHQILHVFSHGNQSPAWLCEGVAVYTQSPHFASTGAMQLGVLADNYQIRMYFDQRKAGTAISLEQTMALTDGRVWASAPDPSVNYPAAGALVEFCMEGEGRKYRADFIDFLRDSYLGTTMGRTLPDYLNLNRQAFAQAYEKWLASDGTL